MRNILLTGSTGGFGPTLARHFDSKGDRLLLHGRNQQKLDRLRSKLASERHLVFIADPLEDVKAADMLCKGLDNAKIVPDIVIHHVGGTQGVRSALARTEDWISVLTVNVLFAAEINRLLMDGLIASDKPVRIIHISSISALSLRGSAPYAASKALLNSYIVTLSREVSTTKVVVCGVMPGAFLTPGSNWERYKKERPEVISDFLRHHHATERLGAPEEIIPAVECLADFNNTFSQGCIMNIDGGTM